MNLVSIKPYNVQGNHVISSYKTKEQLFKEFEEYSQPLARAFALCSIHEAMKLQEENI